MKKKDNELSYLFVTLTGQTKRKETFTFKLNLNLSILT